MSKSKGEFLTVSLLESKGYSPLVYRLFCLQSHYRKSLVFSYENLDNAKVAYEKLLARIAKLSKDGEVDMAKFEELKKIFTDAMDNDINTSLAITAVYDVLKSDANDATKRASIKDIDYVLSLNLVRENEENDAPVSEKSDFEKEIEALIAERAQAKKDKNFARADEIRNDLKARGVTLLDTREGTTYTIE
jgi:cysteinyl-tRNA synthetase